MYAWCAVHSRHVINVLRCVVYMICIIWCSFYSRWGFNVKLNIKSTRIRYRAMIIHVWNIVFRRKTCAARRTANTPLTVTAWHEPGDLWAVYARGLIGMTRQTNDSAKLQLYDLQDPGRLWLAFELCYTFNNMTTAVVINTSRKS